MFIKKKFIRVILLFLIFTFYYVVFLVYKHLVNINELRSQVSQSLNNNLSYIQIQNFNENENSFEENWLTNNSNYPHRLYENEGDIASYSAFTIDMLFPSELGIYKRNVIKLTGIKLRDLHSVVKTSIESLNKNKSDNYTYQKTDFMIGFYRVTPIKGFEYFLYFKKNHQCCSLIYLKRPLIKVQQVEIQPFAINKTVNIIMALSFSEKNYKAFTIFMKNFESILPYQNVTLTIVYAYNKQNKEEFIRKNLLENSLNNFKQKLNFKFLKNVFVDGNFSRSKLLTIGAEKCCSKNDDDLLFFTDVDVYFNENFLNLCKTNAIKHKRVFFPILYSYYNPKLTNTAPNSFTINKNNGYWRDSGFGMVCIYNQDFIDIGKFFLPNGKYIGEAWGGEDLMFYRKFLKSKLEIIRSITPGIFHIYHSKECDKSKLNRIQYKSCLHVKVLNEASKKFLGFHYFNLSLTDF